MMLGNRRILVAVQDCHLHHAISTLLLAGSLHTTTTEGLNPSLIFPGSTRAWRHLNSKGNASPRAPHSLHRSLTSTLLPAGPYVSSASSAKDAFQSSLRG